MNKVSIAHFSDIHLCGIKNISFWDLFSKRLYGYVYWYACRGKKYDFSILVELEKDLTCEQCDHIVITGDLTHLSLTEEFIKVKNWLKQLGGKDKITLVPGNHDFYVLRGRRYYEKAWNEYIESTNIYTAEKRRFPFVRVFKDIALVGVNSAVVTPPFFAYGFLGKSQLRDLEKLLQTISGSYFTILLIHHPPLKGIASSNNSLIDFRGLVEILKSNKIKLVLYGHAHYFNISYINSGINQIPVVGVPAVASCVNNNKLSGYNIYYIEKFHKGWSLTIKRKVFSLGKRVFEVKEMKELSFID